MVRVASSAILVGVLAGAWACGAAQPEPAAVHAMETAASITGLTADQSVDLRLLVLTGSAGDSALAALSQELDRAGTPYTVIDVSSSPVTATVLSDGASHGRFNGIVLTSSSLMTAAAVSWNTLLGYMATFNVRYAILFANPQQVEGFAPDTVSLDTGAGASAPQFTPAAAPVFGYAAPPVPIRGVGAWGAHPDGTPSTTALLVDAAGDALAATHRFDDGREALYLTFEQTPTAPHSLQLLHGVVAWVTRGIYVGEKRLYMNPQLDDMFLGNFAVDGSNYRITGDELRNATAWVRERRATTVGGGLTLTFAFNGSGTNDGDPLLQAARETGKEYFWVSHTFSHLTLNDSSYDATLQDLRANDDFMKKLALGPFDREDLVPPSMSGLWNVNALNAMKDFGIRYLICDTSRPGPGCDTAPPNVLVPNPDVPAIQMLPRRPTALFSYVSTPAEWVDLYNSRYAQQWGHNLTVEEIVEHESDTVSGYVLRGEMNPWMFHQGNLRAYDGKRTLLTDLLGRTLDKVGQVMAMPVTSIPMSEIGRRLLERMQRDSAGVVATLGPGESVTVRASQAARVTITGVRTADAESHAGMVISRVEVPAGGAVTVPLAATAAQASNAADGGASGDGATPPATGDGAAVEPSGHGGGGGCSVPGGARPAAPALLVLVLSAGLALRARRGSRSAASRTSPPTRC